MIWGRWKDYIANGNGGNIELKSLDFEYIQKNFRYSILEIYKSTTDDDAILERESWWKELLMTRQFGYNKSLNIALWDILNKIFLIMILGGMVVSIYIIGKKYE